MRGRKVWWSGLVVTRGRCDFTLAKRYTDTGFATPCQPNAAHAMLLWLLMTPIASGIWPGAYGPGHMARGICPRAYATGHTPQGICHGAYATGHTILCPPGGMPWKSTSRGHGLPGLGHVCMYLFCVCSYATMYVCLQVVWVAPLNYPK